MNIEKLYEDKDLVVINKPAGVLVHSDNKSKEETIVDWLRKNYPSIDSVGDAPDKRPGIVHRLDKDTSGVLLIAKTGEAFRYLKSLFQKRDIEKRYRAIVVG
ncbi:MAG: RluA family pseudouridine synthase, partial [Candidatus Colwellbacteria bacterium CG10_big_fil_rev_8_21_14_0_10_41_28]